MTDAVSAVCWLIFKGTLCRRWHDDGQVGSLARYDWLAARTGSAFTVAGDSAGGALAVAIALEVAKTGRRHARAVIASSGWFDLRMRGQSWQTSRGQDLVTDDLGQAFVKAYLGSTEPSIANRLVYEDLNLLPPMLVQMGGHEGPLSDAFSYVMQARAAGASVQLEVYAEMPHNFIKFASPVCDQAFNRMGEDLVAGGNGSQQ